MRRLILLIPVGWVPPYLPPSGACLCLGSRVLSQPRNAIAGATTPGRRLCRCTVGNLLSAWLPLPYRSGLRYDGTRSGKSPQESSPLTGHGHGHQSGVLASCHEAPVTMTQPHLRFPTDVLEDLGWWCESQWQLSADLRGIAIGPGAFDEPASGMAGACLGHRPLSALRPGGVCCGSQAHALHQCSGGRTPGQGTQGCSQGDGHRAWHAAPGLQSLDHRGQPPGLHVLVECLLEPLEVCGMRLDYSDVGVKNTGLRGRGTDHGRAPPQVGRAPTGPGRGRGYRGAAHRLADGLGRL
jgi:hypothetical protein